jgi:hypothetical protein
VITIRFVQGSELSSKLIVAQEKVAMPFTPSHVEILTADGKYYLGSMLDGGVKRRPVGYDAGTITHELLLPLDTTTEQETAAWAWAETKIGEPYDSVAIFGFVIPIHEHTLYHAICSAFVALFLRACEWFQWPLAAPAHLIDPRDLLLVISGRMHVPM